MYELRRFARLQLIKRNNWLGMIDNRTRMTDTAHGDGGRIHLAAANKDGVLFAARSLSKQCLIHLLSNHYVPPTDQG
jgi:hypothetical protein